MSCSGTRPPRAADLGGHDPDLLSEAADRAEGRRCMRLNAEHLDHARRVADAILYEGYLLYPYHQAAQKNQVRFQFGVLMPRGYAAGRPERGQLLPDRVPARVPGRRRGAGAGAVPAPAAAAWCRASRRRPVSCTTSAPCRWTAPSTPPSTRRPSASSTSRPWCRALLAADNERRVSHRSRRGGRGADRLRAAAWLAGWSGSGARWTG